MAEAGSQKLRVAIVGLGTIGVAVATSIRDCDDMIVVGGVDLNSAAVADAKSLFGDLPLKQTVEELPPADVAIACVGRRFDRFAPTIRQCLARRMHVVSDCAEMAWPWLRHPHLADVIAGEARKAGVAVIGTGPDPAAYVMSHWREMLDDGLTRLCIRRHTNLAIARPSVLRQAGIGSTAERFRKLAAERIVGLPGQAEWVVLLAQGSGLHPMQLDVRTSLRPIMSDAGTVNGLEQKSHWSNDTITFEIEETATFDARDNSGSYVIDLGPLKNHETRLIPVPEPSFVAAGLVDVARHARSAPPGLLTPLDIFSFTPTIED